MLTRTKLAAGSLVGAVAIHLALIACGTAVMPRDDAALDSGTTDAPGGADITPRDALSEGLADALADALAEGARDVLAAEVGDAEAGPMDGGRDGGTSCTCPPPPTPPSYTVSFTASGAPVRTSETIANVTVARQPTFVPTETGDVHAVTGQFTYWSQVAGSWEHRFLRCLIHVRPDLSIVGGFANCRFGHVDDLVTISTATASEPTLVRLTETEVEFRVRTVTTSTGGAVFSNLTFRANVPAARFLTPPTDYRP